MPNRHLLMSFMLYFPSLNCSSGIRISVVLDRAAFHRRRMRRNIILEVAVVLALVVVHLDDMAAHVDIIITIRIHTNGIGIRAATRLCHCPRAAVMPVAMRQRIRRGVVMGVAHGPAAVASRRPAAAAQPDDLGMELIKRAWVVLWVVVCRRPLAAAGLWRVRNCRCRCRPQMHNSRNNNNNNKHSHRNNNNNNNRKRSMRRKVRLPLV